MHIGFTALEAVIAVLMLLCVLVYLTLPLLAYRRRRTWQRHVHSALEVLGQRRAHDDLDRRWP